MGYVRISQRWRPKLSISIQCSSHQKSWINDCIYNSHYRRRFGLYKAALPTILGIDEALASCSSLQTLCDTLRSYEDDGNYTLMHLAVQLDLRNVVVDPILAPLLDVVTNSGITPLMLAVKVIKFEVCLFKHAILTLESRLNKSLTNFSDWKYLDASISSWEKSSLRNIRLRWKHRLDQLHIPLLCSYTVAQ